MSVPPPYPQPVQPGGWNAPPGTTNWSPAPVAGGFPPPGVPFYPGPPQPGRPGGPKPGTNGFAVAALIFGIIGGVLLSVIFGIIGLSQTTKTGQNGRGLALAGLILSGVWIVVAGVAVVVGVAVQATRDNGGSIDVGGDVSVTSLQVGDCVNNVHDTDSVRSLPAVPCAQQHEGEVFAVYDLPAGPYPDELRDAVLPDSILKECTRRLATYAPHAPTDNVDHLFVLLPLPASWEQGDRAVRCIATAGGATMTGSLKDK